MKFLLLTFVNVSDSRLRFRSNSLVLLRSGMFVLLYQEVSSQFQFLLRSGDLTFALLSMVVEPYFLMATKAHSVEA